jgi:hypothetical protein
MTYQIGDLVVSKLYKNTIWRLDEVKSGGYGRFQYISPVGRKRVNKWIKVGSFNWLEFNEVEPLTSSTEWEDIM